MNNGMGGNVANNMDPIANVNIFRWYRAAADEYAAKPTKMVSIKNKQPQQTILQIILIRMFQDRCWMIQNSSTIQWSENIRSGVSWFWILFLFFYHKNVTLFNEGIKLWLLCNWRNNRIRFHFTWPFSIVWLLTEWIERKCTLRNRKTTTSNWDNNSQLITVLCKYLWKYLHFFQADLCRLLLTPNQSLSLSLLYRYRIYFYTENYFVIILLIYLKTRAMRNARMIYATDGLVNVELAIW